MRVVILATVVLALPVTCAAVELEKFFYVGEVKLSSATNQPLGSHVILFEKIHDRNKSQMTESAVVVKADGKADEFTMRIVVKEDNTFTLTDDAETMEGSGKLAGPPWKWTYFKATYKTKLGVQIEDENFMADDSMITARKKVSGPDGKVSMYMDMSLKSITPKTFEILKAGLLRK